MWKKLMGRLLIVLLLLTLVISSTSMAYTATAVKITKQPVSVTVSKGSTAKVTFTAKGDGLTYKWYYKDAGASKFSRTTTFKGNTYTAEMNKTRNGRQIYCVVTDKYGNSAQTDTVKLSMGTTLKISKQPASVSVLSGSTAKVTFTAKGDGLTYKWYYKNAGASKFSRTTTFKGNTYTATMNKTRSGRQVYCVVTDKYGSSVQTKTVTLKMGTPVKITKQPVSVTASKGTTAKVTVTAEGDGLTYKWYYKNAGASKFSYTSTYKGKTYSAKMSSSRNGRQVYCVITDQYGKSVKTNTVKLNMGTTLKVTKQPKSVSVSCGGNKATLKIAATGDKLTYKWYYKNAGASKFSRTTTFKGTSYEAVMTDARDGRQIYCVITDKYGSTVQTNTVTLSVKHKYDAGVVTRAATCSIPGEKVYTCSACSGKRKEEIATTKHKIGSWKVYQEPTVTEEGIERRSCSLCSYYEDRPIEKLEPVWYITANVGAEEPLKVGVGSNGKYTLEIPKKAGYAFKEWKNDATGETFSNSGTISGNTKITAVWELDGTSTLKDLIERAESGVDKIKITANITVDQPIFISYNTQVYADEDYTLKRDPAYAGDIFVVGQNSKGKTAVMLGRKAELTLGGGEGTLTIDGNKDALKTKVLGSAVFVADSAYVNITDGVRIANNKKLGNARIFDYEKLSGIGTLEKAGGAAILNYNATVNIYGGVIENNIVATEYTVVTTDGVDAYNETNGCGGAVYNRGNFNMHGGTINNSEALRGGGIYTDRIVYLNAGTISNNTSTAYGGGLASSSTMNADIYVGTESGDKKMVFSGNRSKTGGALYSNTSSPIIIYGNAKFENNTASSSGGAIYTAGPLTVRGAEFYGNSCEGSGGAIYHYYTKAEFDRRHLTVSGSVFEGNQASLGGAIILSASDSVSSTGLGTYATITNSRFTENKAVRTSSNVGNGGAIYITRKSEATISGCTFSKNTAAENGGGVANQSNTKVDFSDSSFSGNTAMLGGGTYIAASATITMDNVDFEGNKAVFNDKNAGGNGGAIYLNDAKLTVNDVDFKNNSAANHAGAIYQGVSPLTLDSSCTFDGNSAGAHGGAFYLTYKTVDNVKYGAVLNATGVEFKNNSAGQAGGAISIRSSCEANLNGAKLTNNSTAADFAKSDTGGGAVYVGYGKLKLTNVTAQDNTAAGYGGVVNACGAEVTVTGGSYTENKGGSGGVFNALDNSTLAISATSLNKNESTYVNSDYNNKLGGGAVNITGGTLTIASTTLDGNKTNYYGGAVHTNKTTVKINGSSVVKNSSGTTGGALYFRDSSKVTLENISVTDNTAKSNGSVYINGGSLMLNNVTATGNEANSGGVLYTSGAGTQVTLQNSTWSGNSAKSGGAIYTADTTVTLKNFDLKENEATLGGAIYSKKGTIQPENVRFTGNYASSNGGAVDMVGGKMTISDANTVFTGNTADGHAGAIYVSYNTNDDQTRDNAVLTMTAGSFSDNAAMAGGAISIRTGGEADLTGITFTGNKVTGYADTDDGDGEGGGAIYVGYGTLKLNNVTMSKNTASGFGGAVDSVGADVTVIGGTFSENTANSGGAFHAIGSSDISLNGTTLSKNESTYVNSDYNNTIGGGAILTNGGTLTITGSTFDGNKTGYYGGTIHTTKTTVKIDGNSVVKGSYGATGGALFFRSGSNVTLENISVNENTSMYNGVIYANGSTLDMINVSAMDNECVNGVLFESGGSTKVTLQNSTWRGNTATKGGAVHMTAGTLTIKNSTLKENAANQGGAVYCELGTLEVIGSTFTNNAATKNSSGGYGNGGAICLNGGTMNASGNNNFRDNSAENHAGAIYVVYHTAEDEAATVTPAKLTMTDGLFENNTAEIGGGAISSRTNCEVTLTGTKLKNNTANGTGQYEGGGAIYSNNNVLTLSGVEFDGNVSGFYGGAIGAKSVIATIKDNTVFKNNIAATGAALECRENGTYKLTDVTMTNNTIGDKTGNGAAIYITGLGSMEVTNLTATGNKNANGGAFYVSGSALVKIADSNLTDNTALGNGGAIDNRSSKEMTVTNTTISGNTAATGGAIYTTGKIKIEGTAINENTASGKGGAIYATGTGAAVTIGKQSTVNTNTAPSGGAIYEDLGATVTINDSTLDGNKATGGDGGAILVADTTKEGTAAATTLAMTNAKLSNNTASAKGGAVSTDTSSVNLVINASNCVFEKNESLSAGGGAVEIQNGNCNSAADPTELKLVFKDCTFTENIAKTTGAGIEIRTNSCAKIDGITATKNKATDNGGVIYVTSNYSRLYLTGTVTQSNNTAKSGNFVYLYNNNYTNPPKIYTTDSNSAAWYKDVKGNSGNVAFDLTTMP